MDFCIINGKIITMENENIENGYIKIRDGKISEIGRMKDFENDNSRLEITDAGGAIITPGMIDAHSHIGMWEDGIAFEGDDGNEDTDPTTPQLRALDGINPSDRAFGEALHAGVTTVIVGPGSANPIAGQILAMKTAGLCIDDMLIAAPVGIKAAFGENPKSVYHDKNQAPVTRMGTAAVIREILSKAKEYAEQLDKYNSDPENEDKPEWEFKSEALLPLIRREIPLHAHAHRLDDIFTAIRIAKEFNLRLIIVHGTEAHLAADRIAKENVSVLSGPILTDRSKPELRNQSESAPAILAKAGVPIALITDHPETPEKFLALCAQTAINSGLEPFEALKAITITPARICGIDERVGSIKPGKDADLIIWDGEPMSISFKPRTIFCGGKIINQ